MTSEASKPKTSKGKVSVDQAYRMMRGFVERVRSIYSEAQHFKLTHEDIMDRRLKEIHQTPNYKRLPQHYRMYIDGYEEALRDNMWKQVVWVLSCDGCLMTGKQVDALTRQEETLMGIPQGYHPRQDWEGRYRRDHDGKDYRSPWSRINGELSRHVWKDEHGQPMLDKPLDRRFQQKAKG